MHKQYRKDMSKKSFRQQVIELEIGQELTIPVSVVGYTTIRNYASDLGFAYRRKYTTSRNRENRTYTIKRIS